VLSQQRRRHRNRSNSGTAPEEDEHADEGHEEVDLEPQKGLWLYLAVPTTGILLCGSKEPWALGILAILVGLCALFLTPRHHLSSWISKPVIVGVALCLAAFLPATWFAAPEWREVLERDFGVILPGTRSPQPGVTFESWLLLAVGAVWLVCCLARGFANSERRTVIRVLGFFCFLIAIASIVVRKWGLVIPWWRGPWDVEYLGPFPNRNLFSELMAVGGVLVFAAAYDAFRRQQRTWWLFGLLIIPMFAGVLLNTARAGVIVFFGGLGAWMFTAAFHKRSAHRVAIAAAVLLIFAAAFMLFGGPIKDRFFHKGGSLVATLSSESRIKVFGDAIDMISDAPMLGAGLGNFEPVFAMTRESADLYSRALHPESDWLWFGAEAGVICLTLAVFVLIVLLRRFGPWRKRDSSGRRDRRMRNAAGIGAILLCVAGLVDPAMHAPGFFFLGCLLAGLALHWTQKDSAPAAPLSLLLRKGAGVFCLITGVTWILIATGRPIVRGNSVYRQLSHEAQALSARGDAAGALEKWNEAVAIKPLQWNVYFERALLKLRLGRPSREALDDFARARRLEPHNAERVCLREFDEWLEYSPVNGIPALQEALKRDPARAVEFYAGRVRRVEQYPELRPHLERIARSNPKFMLAYLPVATPAEFPSLLEDLLKSDRELRLFTATEKLRLFELWYERGDVAALIREFEKNPGWQKDGWIVLASHLAKEGDFQKAYEVAKINVTPPAEIAPRQNITLESLARAFELTPTDLRAGLELHEAQLRQFRYDDALKTLDQLAKLPQSPTRLLFERGRTLAAKGDYPRAWEALRDYHQRLQREKSNT
jgi:O-antigen ligase/tetratricopeptide (TPR) repeat protein